MQPLEKPQTDLANIPFPSYRNVYRETVMLVTEIGLPSLLRGGISREKAWKLAADILFIEIMPS
jgi:hypothetical protein